MLYSLGGVCVYMSRFFFFAGGGEESYRQLFSQWIIGSVTGHTLGSGRGQAPVLLGAAVWL